MPGITANFDDWRKHSVIEARELAVLMHGFDPRALADVVVQNPDDPRDPHGVPLDYSSELRLINGAAIAGDIDATGQIGSLRSETTQIIVSEKLGEWLIRINHHELAENLGLASHAQSAGSVSPPKQRQSYQEEAVLATIKTLGHKPQSLPKPNPGMPGVKQKVRNALKGDPNFGGKKTFDKAWERLRGSGDIQDAT